MTGDKMWQLRQLINELTRRGEIAGDDVKNQALALMVALDADDQARSRKENNVNSLFMQISL